MKKFIIKLQDQPLEVRKQVLIFASISLTALVVLVWILTLAIGNNKSSVSVKKDDTIEPFLLLKNNIVQVYANAQKGFDEAKNGLGINK